VPELPDITVYIEALQQRVQGSVLDRVRLGGPFLLRTVTPPLSEAEGHTVTGLRRVGKRVAIGMDNGIWLVLHLMIAGRLHWQKPQAKIPGKRGLASFDFAHGSLMLTEAGSQKRASLHVVSGEAGLAALDAGGLEVMDASLSEFSARLTASNHTLKRALTDPRILSGIGNAYSDEILHRAKLSPVTLTSKLDRREIETLFQAIRDGMREWTALLRDQTGGGFPENVTAFRPEMAVHGKLGKACPRCGEKVQRIRYASNETNYCPKCQTGGKLLADRALSRLLGADWPKTPEELELRISAKRRS